MAPDNVLNLKAAFDRKLIWQRGGSVRYLLVEVEAADVERTEQTRSALNLGLVVDVSGSMAGAPIEAAKQAAHGIVDTLLADDRLSVVTFDSTTEVVLDTVSLDKPGRRAAHTAIDNMHTKGCTNLGAGWLDGAECVARGMAEMDDGMHRVLVLSDGHANRGECNPVRLSEIAEGLRERGVLTSCVGIGDGYSPTQLQAISESGGGRLHDAQHPHEIVEVVSSELETICKTVAENITIHVGGPDDLAIEPFGFYPCRADGRQIDLSIGSLLPGASRRVVLKFFCLTKQDEVDTDRFTISVHATCQDMRTGEEAKTPGRRCVLTYARGRDISGQDRDAAVSIEVARIWQAHVVRHATQMNLDGAYGRAQQYVRHQLHYFDRYCHGLPGGAQLLHQLELTLRTIDRPWSHRSSIEVMLGTSKSLRAEEDYRHQKREHWSDYVGH